MRDEQKSHVLSFFLKNTNGYKLNDGYIWLHYHTLPPQVILQNTCMSLADLHPLIKWSLHGSYRYVYCSLSIVVTVSLDKSSYKPSMQCGVASFKHRYSPNKTTDGV